MLRKENIIIRWFSAVVFTALAIILPTSCDIYEDLEPCPRGLSISFVYDYNMERANAFHSQVDCVTLYVYDESGKLVLKKTEMGDTLTNENYRMNVDLEHGKYHVIAYGGMACDKKSFLPVNEPSYGAQLSDLKVKLNTKDSKSDKLLHPLFFGKADFTVEGEMYKDVTVNLIKDTNNIRVLLQHTSGSSIDADDFVFSIVDDNTLFDNQNNIVPTGEITYTPWVKGNAGNAPTETITNKCLAYNRGNDDICAAYAELSTSRLIYGNNNRLVVKKADDGRVVFDVPLNSMLLLLKSMQYDKMGAQEFLDRESNWDLVFFLTQDDTWYNIQIIINGWTVRINETDF